MMSLLLYVVKKEALRVRGFGIVAQLWSTCATDDATAESTSQHRINPKRQRSDDTLYFRTCDCHSVGDIDLFVALYGFLQVYPRFPF